MPSIAIVTPHQPRPYIALDFEFVSPDLQVADDAMKSVSQEFARQNLIFCYYRTSSHYPTYCVYLNRYSRDLFDRLLHSGYFEAIGVRIGVNKW